MKRTAAILLVTLIGYAQTITGQEHNNENGHDDKESHITFKKHKLAVELGYTHIPDGYEDEEGGHSVWVPTFGIEYLYRFSHKWAAAMTVSMETGNYLINYNREDLERENVLIIAAVADYEVLPRWSIFAGAGVEIERHKNFGLVRFGTAYTIPIGKDWEVAPTITFDHKIGYYSYEFVIAIGKSF